MEDLENKIEERMRKSAEAATTQHKDIQVEISKEIKGLELRIDTLEKWKWIVIGGSMVLGYLVSNFSLFSKILG